MPTTLIALQFLFAATHLTREEWGTLEDVLRYYFADDALDAEHVHGREEAIMDSLYHKHLITTGAKYHNPMSIVPTPLCRALYELANWEDWEPRNAYHAVLAAKKQLPLFVSAPDFGGDDD